MQDKKAKIGELLTRGVENIYPSRDALEHALQSGKKLRLYTGIDPTAPSLHLGHMVILLKLRQFQELGHEVIVLVGDFTAQIGDPTDKLAARKPLTHTEVLKNAKDYKKQIGKFLDLQKTVFQYNSRWLEKLRFRETLKLASYFTAQQTLARDMFQKRIHVGKELYLHEFFYPLMQAYDSVMMDVDLEVGGNDQMFNMLAGRTLMKKMKDKEKFVLTMKLLTDHEGVKMGKTTGNMARLDDTPENMYGIILSWPDSLIVPGFELLTYISLEEIKSISAEMQTGKNPKEAKMALAREIVRLNFGDERARKAQKEFVLVHEHRGVPEDIKICTIASRNILDALVETGLAPSKSEARRHIRQGGVKVDGKVIRDESATLERAALLQRGKLHFVKVLFSK